MTATTTAEHVTAAVAATAIIADHGFAWFGKRPPRLPGRLVRSLDPTVRRAYLEQSLAEHLYSYLYVKGYAAPMHWEPADAGERDGTLVASLRRSNAGRGSWDSGWVQDAGVGGAGSTSLERDGLAISVQGRRLVRGGRSGPVDLRMPKELPAWSPGHYLALSDRPFPAGATVVRVYWNCTPRGAVALMAELTGVLNREGIPFRLKVLDDPAAYDRCDAAVLYLAARDVDAVHGHLARASGRVADELQPRVPVFTKPLGTGVAVAEDTDGGRSFGMHRCRALAQALVSAQAAGARRPAARVDHVVEALAERGVDVDAAHLRPGSVDRYPAFAPSTVRRRDVHDRAAPAPQALLDEATAIGERLLAAAHRGDGMCTWLGSVVPASDGRVLATLGPTLYDGLAGVALVLAQLHRVTGDARYADTARGALRQALHLRDSVPAPRRLGLFDGWTGLALAAGLVARELDDAATRATARDLARDALGAGCTELDLVSGAAGGVLAAVDLGALTGDASLLGHAVRLGELLLVRATPAGDGLSWGTINRSGEYHLTGLSHGTAGIALSLVTLFEVTGDERYLEAAELGFAYERGWFDASEGNWPDLRETRPTRARGRGSLAYSTYWCHGAPGIAVSRLRAWQVTHDPTYREEAVTALATTERFVRDLPATAGTDQSLCHGQLGNAAVLALAGRALGPGYPGGERAALEVVGRSLASFGGGRRWPLGTPGDSPGLMLGAAGLAHVLLWLRDPAQPLVLIPGAVVPGALADDVVRGAVGTAPSPSFIT